MVAGIAIAAAAVRRVAVMGSSEANAPCTRVLIVELFVVGPANVGRRRGSLAGLQIYAKKAEGTSDK